MNQRYALALLAISTLALSACSKKEGAASQPKQAPATKEKAALQKAPEKPAKPQAKVQFAAPPNGATVFEDVHVVFNVTGMQVSPAGKDAADKTKGHHHVIVDGAPIPAGQPVPKDATHIHYGKGQLEGDLKLPPGKHKLTMQFADGNHLSYGPDLSATIEVNVVKGPEKPAKVYFVGLKDGAKVKSPVALKFGLDGLKVRPAGEDVLDYTSGHHHVIVDGAPIPAGQPVPKDATHIHFGKGQTEAKLELKPGKHKLTLQLADGAHKSYGPKFSSTIEVIVE